MPNSLPKPNRLRWEISFALLFKIVLLIGLWFLIFRWPEKADHPADMAARLALPTADSPLSSPQPQEFNHVR